MLNIIWNKDFLLSFSDLPIGFQVRQCSSFKKGNNFPFPTAEELLSDPFLEESSLTENDFDLDLDKDLDILSEDVTKKNVEESIVSDGFDDDSDDDYDDYDEFDDYDDYDEYDDDDLDDDYHSYRDKDPDDSGRSFPGKYYTQISKQELPDFSRGKDYPTYLIDTIESLIQLDVKYLSPDEVTRSIIYLLKHIKGAIALLDRENVNFDALQKHVLDKSKVLNRHVTDVDFYIDMFKNIQYLLISTVSAKEHIALNIELERVIVLLYTRIKAVIRSDIIRAELLVSRKLSLTAHSARKREWIVSTIEKYLEREHIDYFTSIALYQGLDISDSHAIKRSIENHVLVIKCNAAVFNCPYSNFSYGDDPVIKLITIERITSDFSRTYRESVRYHFTFEQIKEEARGLRILLLKNESLAVKPEKNKK